MKLTSAVPKGVRVKKAVWVISGTLFLAAAAAPSAGRARVCRTVRGELRAVEGKVLRVRLPDGASAIVKIQEYAPATRAQLGRSTGKPVELCVPRGSLRLLRKNGNGDPEWI